MRVKSDSIGVAVVGAGRIGRMHAEIFAGMAEVRLCGVVDRRCGDGGWVDWVARLGRGEGRGYPDAAAAFDDAGVEAVVIASSSDSHVTLIEQAVAAGKKVLCEKPVAFCAADIDALRRRLPAGALVQVGFNRRFDPSFCALRAALRDGEVGRVYSYHIVNRDPRRPPAGFVGKSGGMLLDFNVHDFDMLAFLSGAAVSEVFVRGANLLRDEAMLAAGDVDTVMINARLSDGALANVDCARESGFGYDQRVEVMGAGGGLRVENVHRVAPVRLRGDGFLAAPLRGDFVERFYESYVAQARAFVAACRGEAACEVGLAEAGAAVAAACAGERSLVRGASVAVAEGGEGEAGEVVLEAAVAENCFLGEAGGSGGGGGEQRVLGRAGGASVAGEAESLQRERECAEGGQGSLLGGAGGGCDGVFFMHTKEILR